MREERLAIAIDKIIELGIMLLAVLIPVFFSFFYEANNLFLLSKTVLFRIIVEILFFFWIMRIIIIKNFEFRKSLRIIFPILILLIAYVSTIFFAIDPTAGFWGTYNRQSGLLTYLHYFILFFICFDTIRSKNQFEKVILSIVAGSFIVSLYGVLEWMGLDFLSWFKFGAHTQFARIISTIGQPVFLGNYLVLTIFLTAYKLIQARNFYSRAIYSLIFIFQFLALIFTYTRGAWIGFILGLPFILFALIKSIKGSRLIRYIIPIILIISALGLFGFFQYGNTNFFVQRIASIADRGFGSFSMRLKIWNAAWKAIAENPFFGYGLDNQEYVLAGYYEPSWSILETVNSLPDRAHNELLDLALSGGIILLGAYLFAIFIIFKEIFNTNDFSQPYNRISYYISVSIIAYHLTLATSFSVVDTSVILFILLGAFFSIKMLKKQCPIQQKDFSDPTVASGASRHSGPKLLLLLIIPAIIFLISYNINIFRADIYYNRALAGSLKSNPDEAIDNFEKAILLNPFENYYKWNYILYLRSALASINSEKQKGELLSFIEGIYNFESIQRLNFKEMFLLAQVYSVKAYYLDDNELLQKAQSIFMELSAKYPYYPNIYNYWGELYYDNAIYDKAIKMYVKALSVIPGEDDPELSIPEYIQHKNDLNNFRNDISYKIAYCNHKLGNSQEAIAYAKNILRNNPYYFKAYTMIGRLSHEAGEEKSAIDCYSRAIALNHRPVENFIALAILYKEVKDPINLQRTIVSGLELYPDNEDLLAFKNE